MPVIEEGLDAAQKAAETQSSSFHRVEFLRIKDGMTVHLRFVSERTATFGMHMGAPTKAQPKEVKGDKWPKMMWGVCQNDKPFRLRDAENAVTDAYEEGYGDCHLHKVLKGKKDDFGKDKSIPRTQTFGLAVLREPVYDTSGKSIIGFKDVTEEFKDEEGTVHTIPKLVVVQQTYSNFWAPIKASMFVGPKTLCDKDFEITRKDKDYQVGGGVTDPELAPGQPKWKRYSETLELVGFDLVEELIKWSSPDWYARWFIEGAVPEGGYGRQGDDDSDGEAPAEGGEGEQVDQAKTDAFREQLKASRQG